MGAEEDIFYRRKRALAVDPTEIPDTDETQKIISRGPIVAYMAENAGEGEFTVNSIFLDGDSTVRLMKLNLLNLIFILYHLSYSGKFWSRNISLK